MFLRPQARDAVPAFDRVVAPALAVCTMSIVVVGVLGYWLAYQLGGETHFEFGP
jgi:hypothetical protein